MADVQAIGCEVEGSENFRSRSERTTMQLYSSGQPGEEPTSLEQILYRDLVIEGIDLVQTANTYGVSKEDVLRSRQRVEAWLIAQQKPSRLSLDDQRAYVQKVVIERLEFVYSEAMNAWRQSRDEHGTTRHPTFELKEGWTTIARRPRGSLLWVAAKAATLLGKFQMDCIDRHQQAESERAGNERADGEGAIHKACPAAPPVGDCSRIAGLQAREGEGAALAGDATPVAITGNGIFSSPRSAAFAPQNGRLAPVQGGEQGEQIEPNNKSPAPGRERAGRPR